MCGEQTVSDRSHHFARCYWYSHGVLAVLLLSYLCISSPALFAQSGVTTLGIQIKPVIPVDYFDPSVIVEREHLTGTIELTGGYSFGMNVRVGLSNTISVETGISQINRNYRFDLVNDTSGYAEGSTFRYVGYEIPVVALVYIRLGERTWMNAALGFSLDLYPSDVQKDILEGRVYVFRNNWAQFGALANLGVEYRTERSGYFYLGGSFHRPFGEMAFADLTYYGPSFFPYPMRTALDGSYLTMDLRYYFHEDPEKRKTKRK